MREIGSVADDLDVGTVPEGRFIHIAPIRDANFGEAGATIESIVPNLRHRWWNGDAREAGATRESMYLNLLHRWWDDGVLASSYQRITLRMDYGIAVLSGVIDLVVLGNGDARETGAIRESPFPNLCHRWWDGDAREAGAILESPVPNLRYRWGYDGVLASTYQRIALRMDYGIAVLSGVIDLVLFGNGDAREALATRESTAPNLRHRWGDCDVRETGAVIESPLPNLRHRWGDRDAREAGATRESPLPNLRHRWRDGDVCKAGATRESIFPNLRHRWGDCGILTPTYQRINLRMYYGIAILSRVVDLIILGNGDAREAGATRESLVPNLRHRWGDGDAREALATRESPLPNLRH